MTAHLNLKGRHGQSASLESLLKIFGADLWSADEIEHYKGFELRKAPPASRLWRVAPAMHTTMTAIAFCIFAVLVVSGGGIVLATLSWAASGLALLANMIYPYAAAASVSEWSSWSGAVLISSAMVFGGAIALALLHNQFDRITFRGPAQWKRMDVDAYVKKYGPMPDEAERIFRNLPLFASEHMAGVSVLVLEQDKISLDPILQLETHDGRTIALKVWDQKGSIVRPTT